MSRPFVTHFHAFVVPKLRNLAHCEALFVATGDQSFSEASDTIMREAIRLGSVFLSDDLQEELEHKILDWLAESIQEHALVWDKAQVVADKVARDIRRFEIATSAISEKHEG